MLNLNFSIPSYPYEKPGDTAFGSTPPQEIIGLQEEVIQKLSETNGKLLNQIQDVITQQNIFKEKIPRLVNKCKKLESRLIPLKAKNSGLINTNRTMQIELSKLSASWSVMKDNFENLEKNHEDLLVQSQELQDKATSQQKDFVQLSHNFTELNSQNKQLKTEASDLGKNHEILHLKYDQLEQRHHVLQSEIDKLREQYAKLKQTADEWQKQNEEMEKEAEQREKERAEERRQADELRKKVKMYEDTIAALKAELWLFIPAPIRLLISYSS